MYSLKSIAFFLDISFIMDISEENVMLTSTKLRILGRIAKGPIHGYGLSKEFNISVSSIYKHLMELTELDFIRVLREDDSRKIYEITEKGKLALELYEKK